MAQEVNFDLIFSMGQIVITSIAKEKLDELNINPIQYIVRHSKADWGDLDDEDKQSNNESLGAGLRLLSKYKINGEEAIYIITEADRSITTILMTYEY